MAVKDESRSIMLEIEGKQQKKNRKLVKRIDKIVEKLERQTTALLEATAKLQGLKDTIQKKKAA